MSPSEYKKSGKRLCFLTFLRSWKLVSATFRQLFIFLSDLCERRLPLHWGRFSCELPVALGHDDHGADVAVEPPASIGATVLAHFRRLFRLTRSTPCGLKAVPAAGKPVVSFLPPRKPYESAQKQAFCLLLCRQTKTRFTPIPAASSQGRAFSQPLLHLLRHA